MIANPQVLISLLVILKFDNSQFMKQSMELASTKIAYLTNDKNYVYA